MSATYIKVEGGNVHLFDSLRPRQAALFVNSEGGDSLGVRLYADQCRALAEALVRQANSLDRQQAELAEPLAIIADCLPYSGAGEDEAQAFLDHLHDAGWIITEAT